MMKGQQKMRKKRKSSLKREKDKFGSRKHKTESIEGDTKHDSNEGESKNTNVSDAKTHENVGVNNEKNEEVTGNKSQELENTIKPHIPTADDEGKGEVNASKANKNEEHIKNVAEPSDQKVKTVTPNSIEDNTHKIEVQKEIKENESNVKEDTKNIVGSAVEIKKKENVEEVVSEKKISEEAVANEIDATNQEDFECSSLICEQENLKAIEAGVLESLIEEETVEQVNEDAKLQEEKVEEEEEVYVEVPVDPAEPYNFTDSQEALKAPFELRQDQLAELEQLWESFQNYTPAYSDIDGYITEKELVFMLKALLVMTYTPEQLQELIAFCVRPPDPEGRITFDQFVKMVTMRQRDFPVEEEVRAALKVMDTEDTGIIDREFMREVLQQQGNKMSPKTVDKLIKEVDIVGDGTINVEDVVGTMIIDLNRDDILLLRQTLFPEEAPTEIIIPDDPTATATDADADD